MNQHLIACTVLALSLAAADGAQTNEFLHVQHGELPVIITAPHGGSLAIPGVPKRVGPEGELKSGKFVTGQDTRTFELRLRWRNASRNSRARSLTSSR